MLRPYEKHENVFNENRELITIFNGIFDGSESIVNGIFDLRQCMFVWSFYEECYRLRVFAVLNKRVLIFALNDTNQSIILKKMNPKVQLEFAEDVVNSLVMNEPIKWIYFVCLTLNSYKANLR
jgi:hypothetical protein